MTTIAWRLAHISVGCLGVRASRHFGDGRLTFDAALIFHINRELLHHGAEVLLLRDLYRVRSEN